MKRFLFPALILAALAGWTAFATVELKTKPQAHTITDRHQAQYFKAFARIQELQPVWDAAQKELNVSAADVTADCQGWTPERGPDGWIHCKEPAPKEPPKPAKETKK